MIAVCTAVLRVVWECPRKSTIKRNIKSRLRISGMIGYVVTALIGVLLWHLVKTLLLVRRHLVAVKQIKLHGDFASYFSFDFYRKVSDVDTFYKAVTPWVYKTGAKHFALWTLGQTAPLYFFIEPQEVKTIMQLPVSEPKGPFYYSLRPWLGDSLVLSSGKKWERNRRLLTPAFHFDILKSYVGVYNRVVDILLENISKGAAAGDSVNIDPLLATATLDNLLRCALSYDGNVQTQSGKHPYLKAVNDICDLFSKRSMSFIESSDFLYSLTANGRRSKEKCDFVHEFAYKIIAARRKALEEDPSSGKKRHPDFLDILLRSTDEDGTSLSDVSIREEVDTFMFAGHETTTSSIGWALHSLAKYPDEQEKVLEEVTTVLGDRQEPDWKDLSKLKYTQCFLKESMRLNSTIPDGSRRLTKPTVIGGVEIPEGSEVVFELNLMNHHPGIWEEPEEFRPSRFSYENTKGSDPFKFVPFSAGARNCIGQNFAMDEMKVFIARILKRFKIEVDPEREATPFYTVALRCKDGIYLHFIERKISTTG